MTEIQKKVFSQVKENIYCKLVADGLSPKLAIKRATEAAKIFIDEI